MGVTIFMVMVLCFSAIDLKGEETLIISGFYTGKDLYVQNPMLPDNKSFSTKQVYVNEELVLSNPITSAFIVNLSHLTIDESVEVRIVHFRDYPPKIINAYAIRTVKVTQSLSFAAVKDVFRWTKADKETIRWLTSGEKGGGTFELQKAHKENWITIDEVPAKAVNDKTVYKILADHQPGENIYRLKLIDRDGYVTYSPIIRYKFKTAPQLSAQ